MLVAATPRGVCALGFGDSDSTLLAELAKDYPSAELYNDNGGISKEWIDALAGYLAGHSTNLEVPLDLEATEFQRRVWDALKAIPYGVTRTYGDIACELGYPKAAARAVGHACATNPVSLIIPCHRAVREDGGLGGYRWGLDRKRALIARESGRRLLFD